MDQRDQIRDIPADARFAHQLEVVYGDRADLLLPEFLQRIERYRASVAPAQRADPATTQGAARWSERDIALITYGDQVAEDGPKLATLAEFVSQHDLDQAFSIVHVLPFCPYSSDDGFSVIDFRQVDPSLGDWTHLRRLSEKVDLMYDLVLNHVSQHSDWFQGYLQGEPAYADWFLEVDGSVDVSQVVRPRSHPLLTEFSTSRGQRLIWTTFSADQIDLNYAEPAVLLEMLDILLMYATSGARVIRLDAIAFLWKQLGTNCLHLPQTHAVVKLFRAALDMIAPHVILLTETNVPHADNVSYFGDGDEADMVYNFSLPPLLLDAYVQQRAEPLKAWLSGLQAPAAGSTWFNFTASHDGIGVRPLEGLLDEQRFEQLVDAVRQRGGEVSMRQLPSGGLRPYELNITWRDALRMPAEEDPHWTRRMLASQALMLALQGVPAVYFHSLVGTPNDTVGASSSGQPRRINRRKYRRDELEQLLANDPLQQAIFDGYLQMLRVRRQQPALHPDGPQQVLPVDDPALLAVRRRSPCGSQTLLAAVNFSGDVRELPVDLAALGLRRELLEDQPVTADRIRLQPYQAVWLSNT